MQSKNHRSYVFNTKHDIERRRCFCNQKFAVQHPIFTWIIWLKHFWPLLVCNIGWKDIFGPFDDMPFVLNHIKNIREKNNSILSIVLSLICSKFSFTDFPLLTDSPINATDVKRVCFNSTSELANWWLKQRVQRCKQSKYNLWCTKGWQLSFKYPSE